ncbi:MAG: hypothetical protein CR968_03540 [Flavobacteriia bacterium]|nr:MAG: hypothetical protein CR968_03540 [Flavobacteriia bacterium]
MVGKNKIINPRIYKYLFDFIVVFVGVFLAFALTQYKDKKNEAKKKREIYIAIFEDLQSLYEAGKTDNKDGFVNAFKHNDVKIDSAIAMKQFPAHSYIYADSWNIPVIKSLINSGQLKDIDIEIFKAVTKFNSGHQIFLEHIKGFNEFYDRYITADYDKGIDFFYEKNTNKLKPKYEYLSSSMSKLAELGALLVEEADRLSKEIKEKHIDKD